MTAAMVHDGHGLRRIRRGAEADALATDAYRQVIDLLASLSPVEWQARTDHRGWTVREVVVHLIGVAGIHASVLELRRQSTYADRHRTASDVTGLEALTTLHSQEHQDISDRELLSRLRMRVPRAVGGRITRAQWLESAHIPILSTGSAPASTNRALVEVSNVLLARDVWLHRFDIARATDRELRYDPNVDGILIADLVADWIERHDRAVALELTGPFGGRFTSLRTSDVLRLDAVDFCLVVAGREPVGPVPEHPLLATRVPV